MDHTGDDAEWVDMMDSYTWHWEALVPIIDSICSTITLKCDYNKELDSQISILITIVQDLTNWCVHDAFAVLNKLRCLQVLSILFCSFIASIVLFV